MASEIPEIFTIESSVKKLNDHLASVRKDALLSIQEYAKRYPLPLDNGAVLKGAILKLFVEKQPLVFLQFVETVETILKNWSDQLQGWVYMIISKFLHKLGSDTIKESVDQKIRALLMNMKEYSTGELVLNCIFRAFADPSQPMNRKTISVSLLCLCQMVSKLSQGDFEKGEDSSSGFLVVSGWFSNNYAYKDIHRNSKRALLCLFCLNSGTFVELQRELPIIKEAYVRQLIHEHLDVLDGVIPGDEHMFYTPDQYTLTSPQESPRQSYETEYSLIKSTQSFHTFQLDVPEVTKRPASTEENTYTGLPKDRSKSYTLPRKGLHKRPMLHSPSVTQCDSPTQSKIPLSRTYSATEKKPIRSKDSRESPSYRQSPKLEVGVSRLPRLATLEDDENPLSVI